jgi:HK97 family phage prohead protease
MPNPTPNPKRLNFEALKQRLTFKSNGSRLEFKQTPADPSKGQKQPINTLVGYALLWNELSDDRGYYKVKLAPGSALFATPCFALYNHDFAAVLGNTANGTLRIMPDTTGIKVEIDLPDTTGGRDTAELVAKKYIGGMSFSMQKGFEEYSTNEEGDETIITVTRFTCDEVTVTGIPAFKSTSIGLSEQMSQEDDEDEMDDAETRKESARLEKHRLDFARM